MYDLTLVFITHDLALVTEVIDRLAVMYAFDFAEVGRANEFMERATHADDPGFYETSDSHGIACHHWEATVEMILITTHSSEEWLIDDERTIVIDDFVKLNSQLG